jgi:hypothetical protein
MYTLVAALVLLSLITGVVNAASFGTINAGDGSIDPAWSATPLITDGADYSDPAADINRVWFLTNAATPTQVAFRVEAIGSIGSMVSLYGLINYEVHIDCNNNDSFGDYDDFIFSYLSDGTPVNSDIFLSTGDDSLSMGASFDPTNGQGETVGTGSKTVEVVIKKAFADIMDLGPAWTTCFAAPRKIYFQTRDFGKTVLDTTQTVSFNFPTALTLTQLAGHSSAAPGRPEAAEFALAAVLTVLFLFIRRKV